jgi:hypothetical protein
MALVYGVALALALLALVIGALAFVRNGVGVNLGFLTVLATTRNPRLDVVARGACLGAEPMPEALRSTRVRYGEIAPENNGLPRRQGDGPLTAENPCSENGEERSKPWASGQEWRQGGRGRVTRHAGFGLEGEVEPVKKGEEYS